MDVSAYRLLGEYLGDHDRSPLINLAGSAMLWERRVAIVATFAFLKRGDAATTFTVAEKLIDDPEVLIHKAVGWMLREVGKRVDRPLLTDYLDEHAAQMPRTMLSYATEHLDVDTRANYRAMHGSDVR